MNKRELRAYFKEKRKNIEEKDRLDRRIFENLLTLECFKNADTVLCYVSLKDEVKTEDILSYCLENNKTLAVPKCLDNKGKMDFFAINSFDELKEGMYGIKEPKESCKKLNGFSNSVLIVPALSFDKKGYRLGYGGGYYDRYIKKHSFICVGLCYNRLITDELPADKFDEKVDFTVTESGIIKY